MPKSTAIRLTASLCKEARHSNEQRVAPSGRAVARKEVLWDSDLRGLGLRLHPNGRKTWIVRYTHERRERTVRLADFGLLTLEEARKRAAKVLLRAVDGEDPFARGDGTTLAEFAPHFASHCQLRVRTGELKAGTAKSYLGCVDNLEQVLGERTLNEIDDLVTRRAFAELTQERGPYAANRALGVLRAVLRLARDLGYRDRRLADPTLEIKQHREVRRGRELSDDELARIGSALDEIERHRPDRADTVAAIRLLTLTGARRREITDLTWGEVDLERRRLRLRTSKTGPKEIALNSDAVAALVERRAEARATGPHDRVFASDHHEVSYAVQYTWRLVRRAAGLPQDVRLHDLRHTYVTRGIASNFSEALVGRAVGHASAATTRRYSHVSVEPVRELVEHVGGGIAAAMARRETGPEPPPEQPMGQVRIGPWTLRSAR